MTPRILTLLLLLCSLCGRAHGTAEGVSAAQFLRFDASARTASLGGAAAALDGVQSVFDNPAGLYSVNGPEVTVSYAKWIMDTSYSGLAFARRFGAGVFAVGGTYYGVSGMDRYDKYGDKLDGQVSATNKSVSLAYSGKLSQRLLWGGAVKYIGGELDTEEASAMAVDGGVAYVAVPDALRVGFYFQNAGAGMKYLSVRDPLPFTLHMGARYKWTVSSDPDSSSELSLLADVAHLRDAGLYSGGGVECAVRYNGGSSYAVRAGYRTNLRDEGSGASFGLGTTFGRYVLDYSFSPMGVLGTAQRVSLSVRFGESGEDSGVSAEGI